VLTRSTGEPRKRGAGWPVINLAKDIQDLGKKRASSRDRRGERGRHDLGSGESIKASVQDKRRREKGRLLQDKNT